MNMYIYNITTNIINTLNAIEIIYINNVIYRQREIDIIYNTYMGY